MDSALAAKAAPQKGGRETERTGRGGEARKAKLPAWKRHAEQPKTVIIIDKNKVANEVILLALSSQNYDRDALKSSHCHNTKN